MPIYDFACRNGHWTEMRKPVTANAVSCPSCGEIAERSQVYRVNSKVAQPRGEKVQTYFDAAAEAKHIYESTDDPTVKAATRPDIWRPAYQRAKVKLFEDKLGEGGDRWADPNPAKSAKERLAEPT